MVILRCFKSTDWSLYFLATVWSKCHIVRIVVLGLILNMDIRLLINGVKLTILIHVIILTLDGYCLKTLESLQSLLILLLVVRVIRVDHGQVATVFIINVLDRLLLHLILLLFLLRLGLSQLWNFCHSKIIKVVHV